MVIGLEVHAELATKTKIFCGCSTKVGAPPNTQCCPVCAGLPGTLPVLNAKVVEYAVKAGLATGCRILPFSKQDRKNYYYPDLPKGYQISQYDLPLCVGGHIDVTTEAGPRRVGLTRIHIEEDAGKLIHVDGGTLIDLNRSGMPLIEIVSEPDMRSAAEARAYLVKLRAILRYAGLSECRMDQGQFRCDVNLSVRRRGETRLGVRTETKNLNSFQAVAAAIEAESERQVAAILAGEPLEQQTRRFDAETGRSYAMRSKEDAHDYRYFPDPDLMPIEVDDATLARLAAEIPELPDVRVARYAGMGLSALDAEAIAADREVADYFERAAAGGAARQAAHLILSELLRLLPADSFDFPVQADRLGALARMLAEGEVNGPTARQVLRDMASDGRAPGEIVRERGLEQLADARALDEVARQVIAENAALADGYRAGREKAIEALIGRVMQKTGGRAHPERARSRLKELLKNPDAQ
ncbi:MAG: Asp-tRNA(Asn)/Glu-tRNA(Gln) amidotransferase subunit GatB [Clostridiales bacterium]|nr:Asp-tRNA(Asn)/Glu-tRNA(Gln) amidotransferase subunit GatB [Clostridiales bacterium]